MFEQFKGEKFNLIYADPAWQFSNKKTGGSMKSGAAHHYKSTMSVDELKAMPIDDIAADDCILVMWYVGSMPQEALDVVKAWGFTLKLDFFSLRRLGCLAHQIFYHSFKMIKMLL